MAAGSRAFIIDSICEGLEARGGGTSGRGISGIRKGFKYVTYPDTGDWGYSTAYCR